MFDIGWTELLLIGIVALIVVGPKDLPGMFRTLGRFTARARALARDFSRAMEEAADEAGVKDVARDLKEATSARRLGLDKIEQAVGDFEKWTPDMPERGAPGASGKAGAAGRDAAGGKAAGGKAAEGETASKAAAGGSAAQAANKADG